MARHGDELVFALFLLIGFGDIAKNRDRQLDSSLVIKDRLCFHERPLSCLQHSIEVLNDGLRGFLSAQCAFPWEFFVWEGVSVLISHFKALLGIRPQGLTF